MTTNIEYTDEFGQWYSDLAEVQQDDIASVVGLLEAYGTKLGFPYSSKINGSKHSRMRELRIQTQGHPIRIFYCFDPKRDANTRAFPCALRRRGVARHLTNWR